VNWEVGVKWNLSGFVLNPTRGLNFVILLGHNPNVKLTKHVAMNNSVRIWKKSHRILKVFRNSSSAVAWVSSKPVVLKLFWFAAYCKLYKKFLAALVYKIKNILIYFKLWIQIKIMDVIELYTNGSLLIFKAYFRNIRGTPSHLLRLTVWESLFQTMFMN
jgi:hypothetical protein